MSIRTVVYWLITFVLAALFLFAGSAKLTDKVDAEMHATLVSWTNGTHAPTNTHTPHTHIPDMPHTNAHTTHCTAPSLRIFRPMTSRLTSRTALRCVQVAASAHWPKALKPILNVVEPLVAKVLPNLKFTGEFLRQALGVSEVLSAVLLLLGGVLASLANIVLIVIMAGAVFAHLQLNEPFVVPLVIAALLVVLVALRSSAPAPRASKKKTN